MKKEYMLSYVIKFCDKHHLILLEYDTGVYCVQECFDDEKIFAPGVDRAYFPSLTKLFYAIQYGNICCCGLVDYSYPDFGKYVHPSAS